MDALNISSVRAGGRWRMTTLEGGAGLFLFDVEASGAAVMPAISVRMRLERREINKPRWSAR